MTRTVRDAVLQQLRDLGTTTIFGNPGSTEIPFLTDLPGDFEYVLGLHEGPTAGIATGFAIGTGKPALLNLHTSAGFGNAIGALANAHASRVPLVVVVGQQDRRHLAGGPFLAGDGLDRLLGDYATWSVQPTRPQDLPAAIARAHHEAEAGRGPAVVVAPLSDWAEPADPLATGAPVTVVRGATVSGEQLQPLVRLLEGAASPALIVGAGVATDDAWDEVVALAETLGAPVWQEPFASRQSFPHQHPAFRGDLPWQRAAAAAALSGHDALLTIGASTLRGYLFDESVPVAASGVRLAVLTSVADEAHRATSDVAVVADVAGTCRTLVELLARRPVKAPDDSAEPAEPAEPALMSAGQELTPRRAFAILADHLDPDAVVVEETPSTRLELFASLPARTPLSLISNGSGGLGFGLAGAVGLRMALPDRPVVAVLGDGSAMYSLQALWTAARYGVGLLVVVRRNRRYAVMDRLAAAAGGAGVWGDFPEIDVALLARGFGCDSRTVDGCDELVAIFEDLQPTLRTRSTPLVLQLDVE